MKNRCDIVVIGAGISGCTAAQELQAQGIDYLLLEKDVEPGGLTHSISVGDAHFDYSGHYLHLSRCDSPADLPYAHQKNEDWRLIERDSKVFVAGSFVPAPIQYNLGALPEEARQRCIMEYRNRPSIQDPQSFKEYLLAGFGKGICECFLYPYNEKQTAVSLDELSVGAVSRFFPYPNEELIENGYDLQGNEGPQGYNASFWYPKYSGIGLLADGLAKDLHDLVTNCAVEGIDLENKQIKTSYGEIRYDKIITSMPLKSFCSITTDKRLNTLGARLSNNRVLCMNLLLEGGVHKDLEKCHWVYIPDKHVLFYRIGFYSHFDPSYVPAGRTALCLEVSFGEEATPPDIHTLLGDVMGSLERLKWCHRKNILVIAANWIECAYVHFKHDREESVRQIMTLLKNRDTYPIGRYGLWDYMSMEDSIYSGLETARNLSKH